MDFLLIKQVKSTFVHTLKSHTILASCWGAKGVSLRRLWDHRLELQQVKWPAMSFLCNHFFHTTRTLSSRFFFFCPHTVIFINITLSKHQSQTVVSLLFNIQLCQTVIIKWIFVLPPKEPRPFLQSPTTELNVWLTNFLMAAMFIGSRLTKYFDYRLIYQSINWWIHRMKLICDILGT